MHTGADLLTDKQQQRLTGLFAAQEHVEVEATWGIYQRLIGGYRDPDLQRAKTTISSVIESLKADVPAALIELRRLGRTLAKRAADVLAYFDRPGTSNGPMEAINGRLEHHRGSALGSHSDSAAEGIHQPGRRCHVVVSVGSSEVLAAVGLCTPLRVTSN